MSLLERLRDRYSPFWLLQIGGWGAFGISMALSRIGMFPLGYMVINKALLTAIGLVLSLGLRSVYRGPKARGWAPAKLLALIIPASYLATLLWTVSFGLAMTWVDAQLRGQTFRMPSSFALVDGLLYLTFVMFAWSVLYFAINSFQELQVEKERALRAESMAHRARLRALRYQLNPHFLFNTLNAVSTLVVEEKHGAATRMIASLGDFLRLTLDGADADQVQLIEEVEFAKRYLDIERIRFEDRLEVSIDVEPACFSILVPSLILQPLVENSIRYAIAPREEGGKIQILARRVADRLHLEVCDDGPGISADDRPPGEGIGLSNIRARLDELYPQDHVFGLHRTDGGGLTVSIKIPALVTKGPDEIAANTAAAPTSEQRSHAEVGGESHEPARSDYLTRLPPPHDPSPDR